MEKISNTKAGSRRVTRGQIVARGVAQRCPNCGEGTFFKRGSYFEIKDACPQCGMRWDKDEAAFLGSVTLNYGFTVFALVLPWIVGSSLAGVSLAWTIAVAGVIGLTVPFLLYRPSKSGWFMCYYLVLPNHLPANWDARPAEDRPPDE
ncbi:MAG: DUF983 domain-containing protein [Rariglobus sp.]